MRPGERAARAAAYERARPEILAHVPLGARRVLDLGCATGTTGAALKQRQNVEAVGVEREPEYAREAATRLDRVVTADLEQLGDLQTLGRFDALIAADVLEHLVDPWATLRACARTLAPGGTAVVSLPNVGHWSTYAHLLRGTWPTSGGSRCATPRSSSPRPTWRPTRWSGAAGWPGAARAPTCSLRRC
jgi:2-polyprenyl-3-methyl-5-hydroxy-6-metoxy-1,4-benzoquinol methylase